MRENGSFTVNTVDRPAVAYAIDCRNAKANEEVSGTLQAKENGGYSLNYQNPVAYSINSLASNSMKSANPHSGFNETKVSRTLDCFDPNPAKNQGGLAIVQPVPVLNDQGGSMMNVSYDVAGTLRAAEHGHQPIVFNAAVHWIVRRLTPTECERLQGYPDGWTNIGEWTDTKGKKHKAADSPRYKALGNSIALPQWFWIVQKMKPYIGDGATLGSLFDGIGGFPLVWQTAYGGGTARWASEIEEFPIAVTKRRFPDE